MEEEEEAPRADSPGARTAPMAKRGGGDNHEKTCHVRARPEWSRPTHLEAGQSQPRRRAGAAEPAAPRAAPPPAQPAHRAASAAQPLAPPSTHPNRRMWRAPRVRYAEGSDTFNLTHGGTHGNACSPPHGRISGRPTAGHTDRNPGAHPHAPRSDSGFALCGSGDGAMDRQSPGQRAHQRLAAARNLCRHEGNDPFGGRPRPSRSRSHLTCANIDSQSRSPAPPICTNAYRRRSVSSAPAMASDTTHWMSRVATVSGRICNSMLVTRRSFGTPAAARMRCASSRDDSARLSCGIAHLLRLRGRPWRGQMLHQLPARLDAGVACFARANLPRCRERHAAAR